MRQTSPHSPDAHFCVSLLTLGGAGGIGFLELGPPLVKSDDSGPPMPLSTAERCGLRSAARVLSSTTHLTTYARVRGGFCIG